MPSAGCRSMRESGDDDSGHCSHDADEQYPCSAGDHAEPAIEQQGDEQTGSGGGEVCVVETGQCGNGRVVIPGQNQARKLERPIQPEAMESGAEKLSCQT